MIRKKKIWEITYKNLILFKANYLLNNTMLKYVNEICYNIKIFFIYSLIIKIQKNMFYFIMVENFL